MSTYKEKSNFIRVRGDIPAKFNELNALNRHWFRYLGNMQGFILPPYEVLIHPSSSCNLRCQWCIGEHVPSENLDKPNVFFSSDGSEKRSEMDIQNSLADPKNMLKVLQSIIDYKETVQIKSNTGIESYTFGIEAVSFSGLIGEPLSSKASVIQGIHLLADHGIRVGLFTNATLFDDNVITALLRADYVLVSLDAATAKTYADLKFSGSMHGYRMYEKVIANVKKLILQKNIHNSKLAVNCSFILYPENYFEVYEAAKLAKSLGINYFRIKQDNSGSKRLSVDQIAEVKELILLAQTELDSKDFKIITLHKDLSIEETQRVFTTCQITDLMAAIGSDGHMYPCNYHPRPGGLSYGDTVNEGFKKIWCGDKRKNIKKRIPLDCPPTCDPFKNRANALMEPISNIYKTEGVNSATKLMESLMSIGTN